MGSDFHCPSQQRPKSEVEETDGMLTLLDDSLGATIHTSSEAEREDWMVPSIEWPGLGFCWFRSLNPTPGSLGPEGPVSALCYKFQLGPFLTVSSSSSLLCSPFPFFAGNSFEKMLLAASFLLLSRA